MRCFRRLLDISYRDHVTNEEVRNRTEHAIEPYEDILTTGAEPVGPAGGSRTVLQPAALLRPVLRLPGGLPVPHLHQSIQHSTHWVWCTDHALHVGRGRGDGGPQSVVLPQDGATELGAVAGLEPRGRQPGHQARPHRHCAQLHRSFLFFLLRVLNVVYSDISRQPPSCMRGVAGAAGRGDGRSGPASVLTKQL